MRVHVLAGLCVALAACGGDGGSGSGRDAGGGGSGGTGATGTGGGGAGGAVGGAGGAVGGAGGASGGAGGASGGTGGASGGAGGATGGMGGASGGTGGASGGAGGASGGTGGASGGTGGGNPGCTVPPDTTGFAQQIADAMCEASAACCQLAGLGYPQASCKAEAGVGLQKLADAARCKGGKWSSSQVTQCLIAIQSFTPSCINHDKWYEGLKQACMEVLTGPENPGDPCGSNFDCFAGAGKYASCTNSNCRVSTFVGLGQACESIPSGPTSMQCNELADLYCYSGKCATFVPVGSSCAGGPQCVQEASCVSGLCTKRVAAGGACSSTGAQCEAGLRCLSSGVCGGGIGASCVDWLKDCAPQSSCVNGKCAMPKFPLLTGLTSAQCG